MNKIDLLFGFLLGIATTAVGAYLFIFSFTDFTFIYGIQILKSQGNLGKIIALGAVPTLLLFGVLIKINREIMARGVLLAVIALALFTLFV